MPADQDYYQVVAQTTGTLDFQVYFKVYSTACCRPAANSICRCYDAAGDVIASRPGHVRGPGHDGQCPRADPGRGRAELLPPRLRRPARRANVVNGYNATIIDTAPPVPYDLELSRSVLAVTIATGGSGYTSTPTVTFTGGGATTQATGVAIISGGIVTGVSITYNGIGYTSTPTVTFTGGGGTAATATASLTDTGDLPPGSRRPDDDSGRSQFDNVTNVNKPTIYIRLADGVLLNDLPGNGTTNSPPAGVIPIPYSSAEPRPVSAWPFSTATIRRPPSALPPRWSSRLPRPLPVHVHHRLGRRLAQHRGSGPDDRSGHSDGDRVRRSKRVAGHHRGHRGPAGLFRRGERGQRRPRPATAACRATRQRTRTRHQRHDADLLGRRRGQLRHPRL